MPLFTDNELAWVQPLVILVTLVAVIMVTLKQMKELKEMGQDKPRKIVTIVDCGETEIRRDFKEGDYIGARTDECPDGVIRAIYAEEPPATGGKKKNRGNL
ncbi:MAG: hypothetical protein GSR78_05670 [Desulfurococcales archaeon]|nr:hypothetical protein [Desulfurococcales archaeon]